MILSFRNQALSRQHLWFQSSLFAVLTPKIVSRNCDVYSIFAAKVGGRFYPSSSLSTAHQKRGISSRSMVNMNFKRALAYALLERKKMAFSSRGSLNPKLLLLANQSSYCCFCRRKRQIQLK